MGPEDIRKHQRDRPFRPFRIHLSDGASYEVRHPELMIVGTREIIVATADRNGIMEDYSFLNIRHIVRIELLDRADAAA